MSAGHLRLSFCLFLGALAATGAAACSLDTSASGTGSGFDSGPGGVGATGNTGGQIDTDGSVGGGGIDGVGGVGGGGAVGGAPAGGTAGQENCFDNVDNDNNAYIDCADPACKSAGYTCEKSPPAGWQAYFRTAGEPFSTTNTPPACPDGSPPVKYYSDPGTSTCTPCKCGSFVATCPPTRIDCSENTDCNGATDWSARFQSCSQSGHPSALSCRLEPPATTGSGSCPASGGQLTQAAAWGRWLYVCGAPNTVGGGCTPGKSCAAPTTGAYSGSICVRKAGEQTCPPGWSTRLVGYTGGTDNRSCSACTCAGNASSVTCSTGAYTFYDHHTCSCANYVSCGSPKVVDSTNCVDLSGLLDRSYSDPLSDWGGSYTNKPVASGTGTCTPSGGAPTGSFPKTGAMTYCCL